MRAPPGVVHYEGQDHSTIRNCRTYVLANVIPSNEEVACEVVLSDCPVVEQHHRSDACEHNVLAHLRTQRLDSRYEDLGRPHAVGTRRRRISLAMRMIWVVPLGHSRLHSMRERCSAYRFWASTPHRRICLSYCAASSAVNSNAASAAIMMAQIGTP